MSPTLDATVVRESKGVGMGLIIWLIIGGIIGGVASLVMKTDAKQGSLLNVVVGIIGSWMGGKCIEPMICCLLYTSRCV